MASNMFLNDCQTFPVIRKKRYKKGQQFEAFSVPCDTYLPHPMLSYDRYRTYNIPEFVKDIKPLDNFSLGESLLQVCPIMHLIFDYLNWRELDIVSEVCTSWKELADRKKWLRNQNRRPLIKLCTTDKIIRSNNFYFYDPHFTLLVYSKIIRKHKNWNETSSYDCINHTEYFAAYTNKIPNCCLVKSYEGFHFLDQSYDVYFASVSLPKLNGIKFVNFTNVIPHAFKETEKIIGLQMYTTYNFRKNCRYYMSFQIRYYKYMSMDMTMAFSGGVVSMSNCLPYGFVIIEDPALNDSEFIAISLVLEQNDDVDSVIKNFKNKLSWRDDRDNIIIIMSQCYGREDNDECCKILQKYFPNSINTGVLVCGEFGQNSYSYPTTKYKMASYMGHEFTYSLMFLMWNNKKPKCDASQPDC